MKFFNRKEKKTEKKSFAPREGKSRPISALLVLLGALLLMIALWDYAPSQNPLLTTDPVSSNKVGKVGVFLAFFLMSWLGLVAWFVPVALFWFAYTLASTRFLPFSWRMGLSWFALFIGSIGIFAVAQYAYGPGEYLSGNYSRGLGGVIGNVLFNSLLIESLGTVGSSVILFGLFFAGGLGICLDAPLWEIIKKRYDDWRTQLKNTSKEEQPALEEIALVEAPPIEKAPKLQKKRKLLGKKVSKDDNPSIPETQPKPSSLKIINSTSTEKAKERLPQKKGAYCFPSTHLLQEPQVSVVADEDDHQQVADGLVQTLAEFGVKVSPGEVHTGPVITRYEVTPAAGVRVEKIANLDKNIALGLRASSVRILAPVPGKGSVGVEVPNQHPTPVCLREIIESTAWANAKAEIPIVLGKDVTGKPLVADLTKMPHLLIAGSTGSGKTVCINAIIASLLYHASPDDLRFIMVDPKIVEMQMYNSLPHMLIPVVTDPKKVPGALKWLINEMENRYQIFAKVGVRNIAGFNAKILKDKAEREKAAQIDAELSPEERAAVSTIEVPRDANIEVPKSKLPYIVCIVDELADLMMVAPADIETCIARLAQLARAAGIHLVIATQRPSVNVITGVIKANLPSRISFKVASKVDSRTILHGGGADKLIGRGDMLFIPPGTAHMVRAQGAYVSDDEINGLVDFLKQNGPPQYAEDVQRQVDSGGEADSPAGDYEDELVPAALDVLRSTKRASTSMLQRRLRIGYNRAARIMEILEDQGFVGPENGAQPREILKDLDSY